MSAPTLTFSKPKKLTHKMTAEHHAKCFFIYQNCNVWTQGGYLVTCCYGKKDLTSQLRKGSEVIVRTFDPLDILEFNPDAKALHYLSLPEGRSA